MVIYLRSRLIIMTRAFLKFYLLLVLPLLIMALLPQNPLTLLSAWWSEKEAYRQYSAIYPLVKEELDSLPQQQWPQRVNELSKHFAHLLVLKTREQANLKDEPLNKINEKGFALISYKSNMTLIFNVEDSDFLLFASLHSSNNNLEEFEEDTRGFRYFLNKKIKESKDPLKELERIRKFFIIDLTITKMIDFKTKHKNEIVQELLKNRLYLATKNRNNTGYILSDDNQFLITIKTPHARSTYRYYYQYIAFLVPAILLAIGALLWMFLFRKELSTLKTAAKSLGNGQLDTRIQLSKSSTLLPISDSFNDMATRLQALLQGQKDLTNAVSHELKTPLSRLHFALEMQKTSTNKEEQQLYTQKIEDNISVLENLVDELLKYTRMQRHEVINLKKHSLEKWLENEVALFADYHPDIDIKTNINTKHGIRFDKHLMSRALNNLLNNAACYGVSLKPKIVITVDLKASQAVLSVEDNGAGIDNKDFDKIFEPFTRLDKSRQRRNDNNISGYGMGLAIVKGIMQQHKGKVRCEDSNLGGTAFILTWPS